MAAINSKHTNPFLPPITPADITIDADGVPVSHAFGDVYFSREGGTEETAYVFLAGNGLPARFSNADAFTIIETGFGTGLNFLVTVKQWLLHAPTHAKLHYYSCEKHPILDLRAIHTMWPELATVSKELLAVYPASFAPGLLHLDMFDGRVRLTLVLGDIADALPELHQVQADAWFLDGFAPAKNPGMWNDVLFEAMSRLSAHNASFATYSAARAVVDGLAQTGWNVEKIKGYGHKRHMLHGKRLTTCGAKKTKPDSALIIGGGIAGCAAARALAERGIQVTLFERRASIATEASGNPRAIVMPYLPQTWHEAGRFYYAAFHYALQRFRAFRGVYEACGVLQLPMPKREEEWLGSRANQLGLSSFMTFLSPQEIAKRFAIHPQHGGLYFEQAGVAIPQKLCHSLVDHKLITVQVETEITALKKVGAAWQAYDTSGKKCGEASTVIIASAMDTTALEPTSHLPLRAMRGQLTEIPAQALTQEVKPVVVYQGYLARSGRNYIIGSTYDRGSRDSGLREEDHISNLARLEETLPGLIKEKAICGGYAAIRTTTPDRLPMVGKVQEGIYTLLGLGSRGFTTFALLSDALAAMICEEALPVEKSLADRLSPQRYN